MDDVLVSRVRRVYAALDSLQEFDLGLLKGHVVKSGTFYGVCQDFTGGLDSAQMENLVESGIYNLAHLKDPLSASLSGTRNVRPMWKRRSMHREAFS